MALHEPRYWDSPDALNFGDLSSPAPESSVDRIRLWLQKVVPLGLLDAIGKEQREIEDGAKKMKRSLARAKSTKLPISTRRLASKNVKKSRASWWKCWATSDSEGHILDNLSTEGRISVDMAMNPTCTANYCIQKPRKSSNPTANDHTTSPLLLTTLHASPSQ